MLEGIAIRKLKRAVDERGSFAEIMRADWDDIFRNERPAQANLSVTYPGIVRAWHRHESGQVDNFIVLQGSAKICAYDERTSSLDEIISSGDNLQIVHIPGNYWHGFQAVGLEPTVLLYFVNNLYKYEKPDEKRRAWNDQGVMPRSINGRDDDPRLGRPWDWFYPPHK